MLRHVVGIVSGGSSGLGAATVSRLVKNGARIVVADLPHTVDSFERLQAASADESNGGERGNSMVFAPTDVTDEGQVTAALDLAESAFGEPVNAAISCAGVAVAQKTLSSSRRRSPTSEEDEGSSSSESHQPTTVVHPLSDFAKTLQINTLGTFNVARLSAQRMTARPFDDEDANPNNSRGCIVNTASVAAYDGQMGQVAYAASKAAVVGMALPMARDLSRYGIRVVTLAPGIFKTPLLEDLPEAVQSQLGDMVPCPKRMGQPDEFAFLVEHVITNPYINGEVIRIDGALRMPP